MIPLVLWLAACTGDPPPGDFVWPDHGPMAEGIYAPLGEAVPFATEEQLATFERGREVALRRFSRADGLGPAFNLTFCGGCHEKPALGGSAGLYRNFSLGGRVTEDGAFLMGESAGNPSGVVRVYAYGDEWPSRPEVPETTVVVAHRNPIPVFGTGLLAELTGDEILSREDEEDLDGDGISGKANWDRGFVGRFGMKSQTVSIEGFIRGPLFNHLGITTDPLTEEQRARLPVDSSSGSQRRVGDLLRGLLQAAASDGPITDTDLAPDPELSTDDLFDVVSFSMLLAPARPEPPTELTRRGQRAFDLVGCADCHTPRVDGPHGPLPVYSDLLVHAMGPDLADGVVMKEAGGDEFRSQPLWGLSAVGPYLHDGRASTIDEAIVFHGGEAEAARDAYLDLADEDREALLAFLGSLGGRDQASPGLLPPGAPLPAPGELGGPDRVLNADEQERFLAGRALFDREFGESEGVGGPRFNGDSCRACHFDPVIGGSGPRDVNVMRHGLLDDDGFVPPAVGTILHKEIALHDHVVRAQPEATVFEHRQTPHLFGLGLVDRIPDEVVLAGADPEDLDGDGLSGKVSRTDGGRLGRFGWKAQVPSVAEFVRDAVTSELGLTLAAEPGLTFGRLEDNDEVPDPEFAPEDADDLGFFLSHLAPPPRVGAAAPEVVAGEAVFDALGCTGCHTPSLAGADGPVPLYSDLLLHEILAPDAVGIEDTSAGMRELRTAPLWGVGRTGPWWHTGEADTLDEAVRLHDGEAVEARRAYTRAPEADREALLRFLESL